MKRLLLPLLSGVITVAVLIWLISFWITLVVGPLFLRLAYAQSSFPEDLYGVSTETVDALALIPLTTNERLTLAMQTVAFLESHQSPEDASLLLRLTRLPHTQRPMYSEKELSHLRDVKTVTDKLRVIAWCAFALILACSGSLFWRSETQTQPWIALKSGGVLTIWMMGVMACFILFGWGLFFVQFHGLFFESGTWTFASTDTLIRLFPEQLFFQAGQAITVGSMLAGGLTWLVGYGMLKVVAVLSGTTGGYQGVP
ncbi:MAG: DUF1461 domain-containing protein [Ardenticatenaceae bacterium]|nr:DUF1461 domain-containing protein [Ardenticatenaceae bacterium]